MSRGHRLFYPALPVVAEHAPHRAVYVGDADGRCEILAWDRAAGTARQVTDRPAGTVRAALDPAGATIWWFDDDLGGVGTWRTCDFDRPDRSVEALPSVPPARHAGIAMAADGTTAVGLSDDGGMTVLLRTGDGRVGERVHVGGYAYLVDLDPAGRLLVVGGDAATDPAVTVFTADGARVAGIPGGPDRRVWGLGFAPGVDPARLLLVVEDEGGYLPATWTAADGLVRHEWCRFDTEITAGWYPDGQRLLVRQDRHARTLLHEVDLAAGTRAVVDTPPGSVLDAAVWPDGDVAYVWTDSVTPPQLRSVRGVELPEHPGGGPDAGGPAPVAAPAGHRREEIRVPGPGGPIPALVALPTDREGPRPAVFLVHGGPFQHARDAYDPLVEILVSTGCAVVRVNYRGSSGYGAAWRNDFSAGVGLTQLEDLAAVRAHLVAEGVVEDHRTALWGTSWGGYLTLLALGRQPELWRLGIAISPVADYVAAFEAATPAVRALDVLLFGGTPDEVPQRYARSSPVTYVDRVRAPVLLAVSTGDVRCPPAPVEHYARLLAERRVPHQLVRRRAGHEDFDAQSHLALMQTVLLFMQRHFDGVQDEGTPVALAMARPVG
ncbi:prolyl oligopeptidase family serine peptidase [Micromonospora sp. HUAS LYJ1]|uniref:prolyl oligopeptidase family serine peptidase n=1 Tax=Micromonospora sp. HUAS LYJ1 TaxID=3061626 RepID=UPI002671962E|nr:prolyl oligopeptidase family serine peptidase [Micromonospora sp. HUAS LYJ1]WKU04494.1 prolyl oligopeptidase family serine peptidase [Micromonospora sp. HUAS LYJ1]